MSVKENKDYYFPCPWTDQPDQGVVAVGDLYEPEVILQAYQLGIFPWPHAGYPLLWFCPDERGILEFKDLHLAKSFQKWIRKNQKDITITVNQNFSEVIKHCRLQKRKGQRGSWINQKMITAYSKLHQRGHVISLECWRDGHLISGIYGVQSLNYFSCESMFHLEDNASKYALISLVQFLKQSKKLDWMDLQMVTPVCESLGAKYISKFEFLNKINCPRY